MSHKTTAKVCGVYCLTSRKNRKQYVGASKDIMRRLSQHYNFQRKGTWTHRLATAMPNRDDICFKILERCIESDLPQRERAWIMALIPELNGSMAMHRSGGGRRKTVVAA